ncbi:MAG: O-antigen ligase family protein [Cyclobacteriaceae bacterium]
MFDFVFKYFLLFPKILITGHWGILIGEIFLISYLAFSAVTNKKAGRSTIVPVYFSFIAYYVFISSILASVGWGIIPTHAIFYMIRILLYLGVFIWAYDYSRRVSCENAYIVKKVFNSQFIFHFFVCLLIMVVYYVNNHPSANKIMWGYEVGLRMIPLAGLIIDFNSFFFLKAISGSGNLLSTWALAIMVLNHNLGTVKSKRLIFIICVLTVLLTVSRGGFLTLVLYIIYSQSSGIRYKVSLKSLIVLLLFVTGLIAYFSYSQENPLPNIFDRLTNTYEEGNFDGSSQGRLDNYIILLENWISHWNYILFGFGFDEETLLLATNQTVVESFFLQVLVCSGLIGIALLFIFYYCVFKYRKQNFWFKCLWEFILFQSIIQWTITGGDFLAPHALYIVLTLIGFGAAEKKRLTAI